MCYSTVSTFIFFLARFASAGSSIGTGNYHSIGIIDGKAYSWGGGYSGVRGDNETIFKGEPVLYPLPPSEVVTKVDASGDTSVVLTAAGNVYVTGMNQFGSGTESRSPFLISYSIPGALPTEKIADIFFGFSNLCVVTTMKNASCIGPISNGKLGAPETVFRPAAPPSDPVVPALPAGYKVKMVSSGSYHTCWLVDNPVQEVWCSGIATSGQLGNNDSTTTTSPVKALLPPDVVPTYIATGFGSSFATTLDGRLFAWGIVSGFASSIPQEVTLPPGEKAVHVSCSASGSVLITGLSGKAYGWGYNARGQLGIGTLNYTNLPPVQVLTPSTSSIAMVSAGDYHSCALVNDTSLGRSNYISCWGYNGFGQFGEWDIPMTYTPVRANFPTAITRVSASDGFTIAIGSNGTVYGVGEDNLLQSGSDQPFLAEVTFAILPLTMPTTASPTIASVSTSGFYSAAVTTAGEWLWWGLNPFGIQSTPQVLSLPTAGVRVTSVGAGSEHQLAIGNDGGLYIWGKNSLNQFGNGYSAIGSPTPILLATPSNATGGSPDQVAVGNAHNLVLYTVAGAKRLFCWGQNGYGNCGLGTTTALVDVTEVDQTTFPTGAGTIVNIYAGDEASCLTTSNNYVLCTGYRSDLNHVTTFTEIGPIPGRPAIKKVALYGSNTRPSMLVTVSGDVYYWGHNTIYRDFVGFFDLPLPGAVYASTPLKYDLSSVAPTRKAVDVSTGAQSSFVVFQDGSVASWGSDTRGELAQNRVILRLAPDFTKYISLTRPGPSIPTSNGVVGTASEGEKENRATIGAGVVLSVSLAAAVALGSTVSVGLVSTGTSAAAAGAAAAGTGGAAGAGTSAAAGAAGTGAGATAGTAPLPTAAAAGGGGAAGAGTAAGGAVTGTGTIAPGAAVTGTTAGTGATGAGAGGGGGGATGGTTAPLPSSYAPATAVASTVVASLASESVEAFSRKLAEILLKQLLARIKDKVQGAALDKLRERLEKKIDESQKRQLEKVDPEPASSVRFRKLRQHSFDLLFAGLDALISAALEGGVSVPSDLGAPTTVQDSITLEKTFTTFQDGVEGRLLEIEKGVVSESDLDSAAVLVFNQVLKDPSAEEKTKEGECGGGDETADHEDGHAQASAPKKPFLQRLRSLSILEVQHLTTPIYSLCLSLSLTFLVTAENGIQCMQAATPFCARRDAAIAFVVLSLVTVYAYLMRMITALRRCKRLRTSLFPLPRGDFLLLTVARLCLSLIAFALVEDFAGKFRAMVHDRRYSDFKKLPTYRALREQRKMAAVGIAFSALGLLVVAIELFVWILQEVRGLRGAANKSRAHLKVGSVRPSDDGSSLHGSPDQQHITIPAGPQAV